MVSDEEEDQEEKENDEVENLSVVFMKKYQGWIALYEIVEM